MNNLWDWWWNDEDLVNIGQIPPGIAILGYLPAKRFQLSNYVVLTKLHSPVPFYKEQNIAEIDIPGRNTPVLQAMGGRGLKYIPIEFTLYGETAHQDLMTLCGWVDAGDPMYFGFDVWVRKILMKNLNFREEKYHNWYICSSELWKYEPLKTLKYPKDVSKLRPIPEIPATPPPGTGGGGGTEPGGGNGKEKPITPVDEWENREIGEYKAKFKKKDGRVDCIPYTIKEGDTWANIISSYYGWSSEGGFTQMLMSFIIDYNVKAGNIKWYDPYSIFEEVGKTICIPKEIILNPGESNERRFTAG
jgi:hypothetical protein